MMRFDASSLFSLSSDVIGIALIEEAGKKEYAVTVKTENGLIVYTDYRKARDYLRSQGI